MKSLAQLTWRQSMKGQFANHGDGQGLFWKSFVKVFNSDFSECEELCVGLKMTKE